MKGITHGIAGAALGLALAHTQHVSGVTLLACIGAGLIGGLLPDIDHGKSIISRYTPGVGHAVRLVAAHRGPTHTLAFAAAVLGIALLAGVPSFIAAAFVGGLFLHLVCDMATPQGIPLLIPVSRRAWRVLPSVVLAAPGVAWAIETLTGAAALLLILFVILQEIR